LLLLLLGTNSSAVHWDAGFGIAICVSDIGALATPNNNTDKDWPTLFRVKGGMFMPVATIIFDLKSTMGESRPPHSRAAP
jgi:hypothetical protein